MLPLRAVQAEHRQPRLRVRIVPGQGPGPLVSPDAVLRAEQSGQMAAVPQKIDGRDILAGAAGDGGHQSHPPAGQQRAVLGKVVNAIMHHIDSSSF